MALNASEFKLLRRLAADDPAEFARRRLALLRAAIQAPSDSAAAECFQAELDVLRLTATSRTTIAMALVRDLSKLIGTMHLLLDKLGLVRRCERAGTRPVRRSADATADDR